MGARKGHHLGHRVKCLPFRRDETNWAMGNGSRRGIDWGCEGGVFAPEIYSFVSG